VGTTQLPHGCLPFKLVEGKVVVLSPSGKVCVCAEERGGGAHLTRPRLMSLSLPR
jgi:hypothetical protein